MRVLVKVKPRDFMPNYQEDDPIYLEGYQKGLELAKEQNEAQRSRTFVTNLLLGTDYLNEKIAFLVDVPLAFVEDVAKSLKSK